VLRATRELLAEVGYGRLTVDAIATRGGVGKAAIYRRYGSKAEMVFAAAVHDLDIEPPADTGSLQGDLLALARLILDRLGSPAAAQATPALLGDLARHPDLARRFQETSLARERADFAAILDRAVQRGELARSPDPALAHLLLSSPLFAALFAFHVPLDEAVLRDLTAVVAAGLVAAGGQG